MGWNASRVHLGSRTSVSFRRPLTNHSPVSPILYRSRRGFHRHSLIRGLLHTSLAMQSCREGSLLNIFVRERLKVSASIARRTSLTSHRGPTWTFEHFRVRSLRQRSHSFRRTAVTLLPNSIQRTTSKTENSWLPHTTADISLALALNASFTINHSMTVTPLFVSSSPSSSHASGIVQIKSRSASETTPSACRCRAACPSGRRRPSKNTRAADGARSRSRSIA